MNTSGISSSVSTHCSTSVLAMFLFFTNILANENANTIKTQQIETIINANKVNSQLEFKGMFMSTLW